MAEITQQSQEGGRVRRTRSSTRIDMTPMVDLAFLLLTFFILTSRLMQPYVMDLNIPEEETDTTIDRRPPVNVKHVLTLLLAADNKICWFVGNEPPQYTDFSANGIRKVLFESNARINDMVILIKPSNHSVYGNMVDIMDEMAITEMKRYYLVDFTPEDEKILIDSKGLSLVDKK